MAKKYWRPTGKNKDLDLIHRKDKTLKDLQDMLEYTADENQFVEMVKTAIPNVSPDQLRELIMRFRDAVREKRSIEP